jgi:hypothetical protein
MEDTGLLGKQASLYKLDSASAELKGLFYALSSFFPMIIYANLTQNTYKIMEYDSFTTKKADINGSFDELIQVGMSTVDPIHKQAFYDAFPATVC